MSPIIINILLSGNDGINIPLKSNVSSGLVSMAVINGAISLLILGIVFLIFWIAKIKSLSGSQKKTKKASDKEQKL